MFTKRFPCQNYVIIRVFLILATCPTHRSFLRFTILTVIDELHRLRNNLPLYVLSCSTSCFLVQILSSAIYFLKKLCLCLSFKVRDSVPHPHKTTRKMRSQVVTAASMKMTSGMLRCVVRHKITDVSEVLTASIIRALRD
jgi:hypothetical protein